MDRFMWRGTFLVGSSEEEERTSREIEYEMITTAMNIREQLHVGVLAFDC